MSESVGFCRPPPPAARAGAARTFPHPDTGGAAAINPVDSMWWLIVFPGLAIMLVVLSINFVGDWLRDAFDVRESI